ncbi:MAG: hypothetical protein C0402_16715 [Thermodesulfovibrio sp.]|nr:hypothetical protein [Thermodesulfovibrio sp.]
MRRYSVTDMPAESGNACGDTAVMGADISCRPGLNGIKVLVMTSGHEATDHRVHNKLACSLKRMGADVTVVGYLEHPDPGDVAIVKIPKAATRLQRFLLQPWRCIWAARNYHPDIIHFHDAELLMTLPLLRMLRPRCRLVYDVHEDFANLMLIRDWLPAPLKGSARMLIEMIEKRLSLLAHAIVGVTPPLTGKFRNRNRISAYNFITADFFDEALKVSRPPAEREYDLVHLGTLNQRRGLFLADLLTRFHEARPGGKSLILGAPAEVAAVLQPLLPQNCVLRVEVPHKEIPGLLGNAKIGLDIHPWPGTHLNVAFPVKIAEYMASECAVVSSSMPVLDTIFDSNGRRPGGIRIITGGCPEDYAAAALGLLDEVDSGSRPGSELRAFALQHMLWDREAEKIGGLYLDLLGDRCAA